MNFVVIGISRAQINWYSKNGSKSPVDQCMTGDNRETSEKIILKVVNDVVNTEDSSKRSIHEQTAQIIAELQAEVQKLPQNVGVSLNPCIGIFNEIGQTVASKFKNLFKMRKSENQDSEAVLKSIVSEEIDKRISQT